MTRQSDQKSAHGRVPQQIDLFVGDAMTGDIPAWSTLPTETQTALTGLMIRLILDHAAKWRIAPAGDGHDL